MTHNIKVDFLGGEAERKARKTTAMLAVVFTVAVGVLAAVGAGASYRAASRGTTVLAEVGNLPIIADIRRLALGGGSEGDVSIPDDRLTILLLGHGGPGHSGPQLTDTILLVTADMKTKKVGIVSIPRDLAFPLGGGRFVKINAVNAYAEQSNPGAGARETADAFEDLFGISINHVVRVNFQGFVDFVDALDGVELDIERSFVDAEYPTNDFKWQVVSFEKGKQTMDGETLLKFVRSRHGSNGEAGDLSRNHRQQLAMLAIKDGLLSAGTLTNPRKLVNIYESVATNVQTDLTAWQIIKLAPLMNDFSRENIITHVLSDSTGGELVPSNVEGSYLLFPKDPDWSEIRQIVQNPFQSKEQRLAELAPKTEVRLELRNGTQIPGFAARMENHLKEQGYVIHEIGNASHRGYEKTVIYDLTRGGKADELAKLKKLLDANVSAQMPGGAATSVGIATEDGFATEAIQSPDTDFLIVLGEGSYNIVEGR